MVHDALTCVRYGGGTGPELVSRRFSIDQNFYPSWIGSLELKRLSEPTCTTEELGGVSESLGAEISKV